MATMLILSIVFSKAFNAGPDYASYVLSGLIGWLFFSQSTNSAISQLIWGEGLFKRIYLPKTVFAISSMGVGFVNLTISIVPLLLVMIVTKVPIRWTILFIPIPMLFLGLFAVGIALLISTFAIYFIDVAEMYQVVLLAWMYLSPVLYPKEYIQSFPKFGVWIARINPMYHLLNLLRAPLIEGKIPDIKQILLTGGISLIVAIIGWLVFASKADEMSYRL
jgi:ABC-2 type transport system permease protein